MKYIDRSWLRDGGKLPRHGAQDVGRQVLDDLDADAGVELEIKVMQEADREIRMLRAKLRRRRKGLHAPEPMTDLRQKF
ncbi:hypothetical protein V5F35_14620 [Xanthobacter sp. V3B-7B]